MICSSDLQQGDTNVKTVRGSFLFCLFDLLIFYVRTRYLESFSLSFVFFLFVIPVGAHCRVGDMAMESSPLVDSRRCFYYHT